jgi:hypothetical protein
VRRVPKYNAAGTTTGLVKKRLIVLILVYRVLRVVDE